MSSLIERLRAHKQRNYRQQTKLDWDAADEIERLNAHIKVLESKANKEIECLRVEQAEYEEEIESLNDHIEVLESDDHEWYLQAERIEKLEAALKPFADAIDSDRPDLALTLHDLRMAHEAIAEVDDTELFKCCESRLAETMRDLPEWKADKDRIEKLEAALKPFADAHGNFNDPAVKITLLDLRRAFDAIAEVDDDE